MSFLSLSSNIFNSLLKKIFGLKENQNYELGKTDKILLVCTHFNLNEIIVSTSLYRAIKDKYPKSDLTIIESNDKYVEISNNLIDEFIVFSKSKFLNPVNVISFIRQIRTPFDVCIVPITDSVSNLSNYISRLSNSKIRVGINSLDGRINKSNFCFDRGIDLNFCKHPDTNISERVLEIVKPFGIDTKDLSTHLIINEDESQSAQKILSEIRKDFRSNLIGINISSEELANCWTLKNHIQLIEKLNKELNCIFYLFGDDANKDDVKYVTDNLKIDITILPRKTITEVAALITLSDLFITNDSSLMHIAGTTTTPQISLFGPTNPFNWAPCGKNKIFLQKSDLIDDITVDEVCDVCKVLLKETK
jgi:heptosyltransferase-2